MRRNGCPHGVKSERIKINLPVNTIKDLDRIAKETGESRSCIVRHAITDFNPERIDVIHKKCVRENKS